MTELVFCTTNAQKRIDVAAICPEFKFLDVEVVEIQGSATEIAVAKALATCLKAQRPVVVDDTSLEFNALDGLPGPYIKAFYLRLRPGGLVKLLEPYADKTAFAQSLITLCRPGQRPVLFCGRTKGTIVAPRGTTQIDGFDTIFQPDGSELTLAEMTDEERTFYSHRRRALAELAEELKSDP